jgi:beta-1,4-mannosyltransferase
MRVLFLPDWSAGNPYQQKLIDTSAELGIEIRTSRVYGFLPVLHALEKHGPADVVHIHWTYSLIFGRGRPFPYYHGPGFVLSLAIAKARGIGIVWTMHNIVDHESPNRRAEIFFTRRLAKLADVVFVHCRHAREAARNAYGLSPKELEKFTIVPHPSYIGLYEDKIRGDEARSALGLGPDDLVFLFFGNIRPYKGVFELVHAFRRVMPREARLVIVGKPADDAIVAELAAIVGGDDRVRLIPRFVDDSEVQRFFRASDYVVFPYRDVLSSGSVLLAMSFAKAIIAPRLGCIPETVDEQGAILYEPSDSEALPRALIDATRRDAETMGMRSRSRAERMTWVEAARRIALVYESVCTGARTAE